jgi:predicted enzyme related to lactoylglutathione lyase
MTSALARRAPWLLALLIAVAACHAPQEGATVDAPISMQLHYLEIVTTEPDATCSTLAAQHGVTFSEPDADLGGARIADLAGGGRISIRAPMAEHETPVVRPYRLVDDIGAALREAESAGGQIAMPATVIEGQGQFAIYMQGGIQHGLWQL